MVTALGREERGRPSGLERRAQTPIDPAVVGPPDRRQAPPGQSLQAGGALDPREGGVSVSGARAVGRLSREIPRRAPTRLRPVALGRYTHRVAISNARLVDLDQGTVRFRYKDYASRRRL
jgi:hypothetical protein